MADKDLPYCHRCQRWQPGQLVTPTEITLADETMVVDLCSTCRADHEERTAEGAL